MTIKGEGNKLTGKLKVSGDDVKVENLIVANTIELTGNNATLDAVTINEAKSDKQDADTLPHVYMVTVKGANPTIKNSTFTGSEDKTTYGVFRTGIQITDAASGAITIENNEFRKMNNVYNAVDFDQQIKVGSNFVFKDNKFDPELLHNSLSLYNFEDNANITIENCEMDDFRISNHSNATATITLKDGKRVVTEAEAQDEEKWAFITMQQDLDEESFATITINVDGFKNTSGTSFVQEGTGFDELVSYWNTKDTSEHKVAEERKATINYNS